MPGAYDKRYEWVSGMAQMKKGGGMLGLVEGQTGLNW